MNIYGPVPTRSITSPYRPRHRHQLALLLAEYDTVAGIVTLGVLILTVAPIVRHAIIYALWPLGYALYAALKVVLSRRLQSGVWADQPARELLPTQVSTLLGSLLPERYRSLTAYEALSALHLVLAGVLTLIAFIFSLSVSAAVARLHLPTSAADTTWLLFAVPILRAARYGTRNWIAAMTGAAIVLNGLTHVLYEPLTLTNVSTIGVQSLWLVLICLLPAILSGHLAENWNELTAATQVASQIARQRTPSERAFAMDACKIIANMLGYDHVNILIPTSEDDAVGKGLSFLGASSGAGQSLVESRFTLAEATGVNGWAAVTKREHIVNDIRKDTRHLYLPHENFPETNAELALPLLLGEKLLGVLDVQSHQPNAFSEDDVATLRAIVPHVSVALENVRNLAHAQGLADISQTIGRRLLSYHDLHGVLKEVVNIAREVLGADNVLLYPRNPRSGDLEEPAVAGDINSYYESPDRARSKGENSAVIRGARTAAPLFIVDWAKSPMATSEQVDDVSWHSSFVEREGIASSAVIPLRMGKTLGAERGASTLGVMFVNYRQRRLFAPEYRQWCAALADLAALAIRSAQLTERVMNEERANLWREIHDGMAQYAAFTRMLLEKMDATFEQSRTVERETLSTALELARQLQRHVNYLIEIWRDRDVRADRRVRAGAAQQHDTRSFFEELRRYAEIVQQTLERVCVTDLQGRDEAIPEGMRHDARMLIREAVHNAVRHGCAHTIWLQARVADGLLTVSVTDDGEGFEPYRAAQSRGLGNIRYRAERTGGQVVINSVIGEGTEVIATMPLDPHHAAPTV